MWNEIPGLGDTWRRIPLFDGLKVPNWVGWNSLDWEDSANAWYNAGHTVTGSFLWLGGEQPFCVLDCEGKKWGKVPAARWPIWLRTARALADILPSWVSAGGDGGHGIRNVLLPCAPAEIFGTGPSGAGLAARVQLGRGEVLCRHGVCAPYTRLYRPSRTVEWYGGAVVGWADAVEQWDGVRDDVIPVLQTAAEDAPSGVQGGGGAPVYPEVIAELFLNGREAGVEKTLEHLEAGASRHYLCKSWAQWAFVVWPAGSDDDVADGIYETWAQDAGFTPADVLKAVKDERQYSDPNG